MQTELDAIVVGSGPNGLAAAIMLAQNGYSVRLYEAKSTVGGGMRTAELTLPGFKHDICSAIHPMGLGSPFFRTLPLEQYGLEWVHPTVPLAHPFDDGTAAVLDRSIELTAQTLGQDARAYRRLVNYTVNHWEQITYEVLGPLRFPHHPIELSLFGLQALRSAGNLARWTFKGEKARGFFAGLASHSVLPLESLVSGSFGLVFAAVGHTVGWPFPRGGAQSLANALASYFQSLGGEIILDTPVESIEQLPPARVYLFDVSPRQLVKIADKRLPEVYKNRLMNFRHGAGVFKLDWALREAIPWQAEACKGAGTLHLGGTLGEIALSERAVHKNKTVERPYVLLAQHSSFDSSRAPEGKHTGWAYCHVPNGSTEDMTDRIENQVERFAPGFKEIILARHAMNTTDYHAYNANYIGGDIVGGIQDIFQLFTRPKIQMRPYTTATKGIYLCSASTPPGGGVHGMCGYFAARGAMYDLRGGRRS